MRRTHLVQKVYSRAKIIQWDIGIKTYLKKTPPCLGIKEGIHSAHMLSPRPPAHFRCVACHISSPLVLIMATGV